MSIANGPYPIGQVQPEDQPVFVGETLTITIAMDSTVPTFTGVTLQFNLYTAPADELAVITYLAGANLVLTEVGMTAVITLPTAALSATEYNWELFRIDTGNEAMLAYGDLVLTSRTRR